MIDALPETIGRSCGENGLMQKPRPVDVLDLFGEDRAALLALLGDLDADDWQRPTACAGWTVRDVALHILGGDLANLSRRRDRFSGASPAPGESVLDFINRFNHDWVAATRRLSPPVICELLAVSGPPLFAYFGSLDLMALGGPIEWAGLAAAPVWLDVAREYTERWHHQQHIRDAVGRPGQTEPRFLQPVLSTFAHALPVAFRAVDAPLGTVVHVQIRGPAGGDWAVTREGNGWELGEGLPPSPAARVSLDQDAAWRLYTKGLPRAAAQAIAIDGDPALGSAVSRAVAIIA